MNVKSFIPESYLLSYERYMKYKTHDNNCGIIHNKFIDSWNQEGYKRGIASESSKMTEAIFGVNRDKVANTESVIKYINKILDIRGNLVDWRIIDVARRKINDEVNHIEIAKIITSIMCSDNPEQAYNDAISFFGLQFSLIAYLFFVRDSQFYVPISPANFDRSFELIGKEYIDCPKLSRNGNWKVYCAFIQCIKDIKQQLSNRYPDENVTLLDAHSVLWIMGEKEFINFYNHYKDEIPSTVRAKETEICAKARIGQGEYRKNMLEFWDYKCAVTGCSLTDILIASHAKPWKDCNSYECRDFYNGLILIPNLDQLFDKGLISFDEAGKILISSQLDLGTLETLGINSSMRLRKICTELLIYMKYHRDCVFIK